MNDGIFDARHAFKLDNPGRVADLRPYDLLKDVVGIESGDTCVDFGSGTGIFSLVLAELAGPAGRVYAVDNSEDMQAYFLAKHPPANVTIIKRDVRRTALDDRIADVTLLAFILHEVKEPGEIIAEACRLLKPEGTLAIVEWKADLDSPGPPRNIRISKQHIEQLFDLNGLTMRSYIDWSKNHYVIAGSKK